MYYLVKTQRDRDVDQVLFMHNHERVDSEWNLCSLLRAGREGEYYYRRMEVLIQKVVLVASPLLLVIFFTIDLLDQMLIPYMTDARNACMTVLILIMLATFCPLIYEMRKCYRDEYMRRRCSMWTHFGIFAMLYVFDLLYEWPTKFDLLE